MCGTVMGGAVARPGSKATTRAKGSYRKLGGLVSGRRRRVRCEYGGPHREGEEPSPMMHGREKSDLAIVAMKPANKANEPTAEASTGANAAEPVERRAGPRGMRTSKARTGLRARLACHRRWSVYGKQLPSYTRGGSRMRESRSYGSVRGAR